MSGVTWQFQLSSQHYFIKVMHNDIHWVTSQKLTKVIMLELIRLVLYHIRQNPFRNASDERDASHSWRLTMPFFILSHRKQCEKMSFKSVFSSIAVQCRSHRCNIRSYCLHLYGASSFPTKEFSWNSGHKTKAKKSKTK